MQSLPPPPPPPSAPCSACSTPRGVIRPIVTNSKQKVKQGVIFSLTTSCGDLLRRFGRPDLPWTLPKGRPHCWICNLEAVSEDGGAANLGSSDLTGSDMTAASRRGDTDTASRSTQRAMGHGPAARGWSLRATKAQCYTCACTCTCSTAHTTAHIRVADPAGREGLGRHR